MKTMQELYSEIIASDERKKAFVEAMKEGKLGDFLQAHDCEAPKRTSWSSSRRRRPRTPRLSSALTNSILSQAVPWRPILAAVEAIPTNARIPVSATAARMTCGYSAAASAFLGKRLDVLVR